MEEKTRTDFFGVERNAETGAPVPSEVPEAASKPDAKQAPEGAKESATTVEKEVDIENHPTVVALKQQIEDVKKSMGGNLSAQREIIDGLNKKIKDAEKGEGVDEGAHVFDPKTIKRVKDLSKEEQEGMTETEKRLFDENADMKERVNATFAAANKKESESKEQSEAAKKTEERGVHVGKTVQAAAKALAGDDKDMANIIIETFNSLKFNTEGLSDEEIAARVATAAGTIKEFKPPKEQPSGGRGKAVEGTGGKSDPYGVDKIIDEASKGTGGGFAL
jgi:hypothetical protein